MNFSFQVSPEYILRQVKDFVIEEKIESAINILKDICYEDGTGLDKLTIINIISGKAQFNENFELIEEIDQEYINEINDIYFYNIFKNQSCFYREIETILQFDLINKLIQDGFIKDDKLGIPLSIRKTYDFKLMIKSYYKQYLNKDVEIFLNYTNENTDAVITIAEKLDYKDLNILFIFDSDCIYSLEKFLNNNYDYTLKKYNKNNNTSHKNNDIDFKFSKKLYLDSLYYWMENNIIKNLDFESISDCENEYRSKIEKEYLLNQYKYETIHINFKGESIEVKIPLEIAFSYYNERNKNNYDIEFINNNWLPICPNDLKMNGDSANHSDLWLSLGFSLDKNIYDHESKQNFILNAILDHIKNKYTKNNKLYDILLSQNVKSFTGNIVFEDSPIITDQDILILSNANLMYEKLALKAGVVIVETGTELSHLFIKGKEEMLILLRMKNAIKTFKNTKKIRLDIETGTFSILEKNN